MPDPLLALKSLGLVWLACPFLAAIIASRRNAALRGFRLGLLFGPLGLIAAFVVPEPPPPFQCPTCFTRLAGPATICPACRSTIHWIDGRPHGQAEMDTLAAEQAEKQRIAYALLPLSIGAILLVSWFW